ncbi:hypothetical protein JXI42_00645 [bacterium]|nr:hypothetical protein [bacterium]
MSKFRLLTGVFFLILLLLPGSAFAITKIPASRMRARDGNPVGPPPGAKLGYYPAVSVGSEPGSDVFREHNVFPDTLPMMIWPHTTVDRNNRIHVVATQNLDTSLEPQLLGYFRSEDRGETFTPMLLVDSVSTISVIVTASQVSDKVAIVYAHPKYFILTGLDDYNNDIYYLQSPDGVTWDLSERVNVTSFETADTFRAYCDLDAIYDHDDSLHIVFNVAYVDEFTSYIGPSAAKIWHWSAATGLSEVADGWYDVTDPGNWNRTVSKPNIGVNPATGYLYCTWTQFYVGDVSAGLLNNGDICAAVSTDGGATWLEPHNLTRTPSPGALPGDCNNDHWASLAEIVDDNLHIIYVNDKDAGGVVTDPLPEGDWTLNEIKYLEIPASDLLEPPPTDTLSTSPGVTVGTSWYDYQQNASMGKMIAVDTEGGIHLTWMNGLNIYAVDRHIYYNYRNPEGVWLAPGAGVQAEWFTRAGYATLSLFTDNAPEIAYHTTMIYLDVTGPDATIIAPLPDTYSSCDDQDIIMFLEDPRGVNPESIVLSVEEHLYTTADPELSFEDGYLTFIPSSNWSNDQEVDVVLLAAEDSLGNPMDGIIEWSFVIDLRPPITFAPYPRPGAITSCPGSPVTVVVRDSISGLNMSAFRFNIRDLTFSVASEALTVEGDLFHFYPPRAGMIFTDAETVKVFLTNMEDMPDYCGPNVADTFSWEYYVDLSGPIASSPQPSDGAIVTEISPEISVIITDNFSGVNISTAVLAINNDTIYWADSLLTWDGERLHYDCVAAGRDFSPGESVVVSLIRVKDSPTICPANNLRYAPYVWSFQVFTASASLPDTTGFAGDTVNIPLTLLNLGEYGVGELEVSIEADPAILQPVGFELAGGYCEGWSVDYADVSDGEINGGISGSTVYEESGVFCFIKFLVNPSAVEGAYTPLVLDEVILNSSARTSNTNGSFIVSWGIPVWLMDIKVQNMAYETQRTLTFGLSERATEGYDPGTDIVALPSPGAEVDGVFRIEDAAYPHITSLLRDVRNSGTIPATWTLPTSRGEGYLTWNHDFLPAGWITINDSIEMHTASTYHFAEDEIVVIRYSQPEIGTYGITLKEGWNLVSLPVYPQFTGLEELFPTAFGDLYYYESSERAYRIVESIIPGQAFWLYSTVDTTYSIGGIILYTLRLNLDRGWNMVGSTIGGVPVSSLETSPPGLLETPVYYFDTFSGSYSPTEDLLPGLGYWILVRENCVIEIGDF